MDRKTDKYPQALREPSVERLSSSLPLRRVEKEKEGESGGGGGGNPNPKQMASIGARNTESHRKIAALLSLIHTFQGERGWNSVNDSLLVILWGGGRGTGTIIHGIIS